MYLLLISISFLICLSFNIHKFHWRKLMFYNATLLLCLSLIIIDIVRPKETLDASGLSRVALFDDGWEFSFDEKNWINVTLPHTPRLEPIEKVEQQWQGRCFYRKRWSMDTDGNLSHFLLRFDGAMHEADVWINDEHLGRHLGGYLPFDVPIKETENGISNILVRLDNTDNSLIPPGKNLSALDFNYYGGLYRHVWLIKKGKQCHLNDPVRIDYENVSAARATMVVGFHIASSAKDSKHDCDIRFILGESEMKPDENRTAKEVRILIVEPRLWSPSKPNLYDFRVEVVHRSRPDIVLDRQSMKIGIRSFELRSRSQYLYINGEKAGYLVGTNRHQEYPYVGYALSDAAQYRDAYKIKQAGFNLVRCSHYPPSTSFLDACDRLGLLVINSIPGWQYFASGAFEKNSLNDVKAMMERDYNHPSVVLWETSLNESPMSKQFMIAAHRLAKQVKSDSLTCGWIDEENAYDVFIPARQHADGPDYYKNYRAKKNKPLLIAEYGDWEYYASKSDNFNQINANGLAMTHREQTSRQLRGDGEKRLLQQAKNFQQAHNDNRRASSTARIIGDANWLMFDYKRGYAMDLESSGIMDINRLPKFAFYFYQSQCTSCSPMIFIANYWTDSSSTTITIYSNCDQVELRLNDRLITNGGKQRDQDSSHLLRPPFIFKIEPFIPGRLEAIGLNNGKPLARTHRSTPGMFPHHLGLEIDRSGKPLTTNDVVFVYAYVQDENDTVIPNANGLIEFSLSRNDAGVTLIGANPARAEAGIGSILLKTSLTVISRRITVIATSSTVVKREARIVVDITCQ